MVQLFGGGGAADGGVVSNGNGVNGSTPSPDLGLDGGIPAQAEENFLKFVTKNSGVLFENDVIQIGCKCEFRNNLGRIALFFGNKTSAQLQGFSTSTVTNGLEDKLNVALKGSDTVLEGGAQVEMVWVDVDLCYFVVCIYDSVTLPRELASRNF